MKSQVQGQAELRYKLKGTGPVLAEAAPSGRKIGTGPVRLVHNISEMDKVQPGDVLVTDMTDPNWGAGDEARQRHRHQPGGRTCHAAIIARELGIPAVVGCGDATDKLVDGTLVTVSCAEGDTGHIYDGLLETEVTEVQRGTMPAIATKIMMNVGNPQLAFDFCPVAQRRRGPGAARVHHQQQHWRAPKAILDYPNIDSDLKKAVNRWRAATPVRGPSMSTKVAEGVATIAAAFWPKPVIVRLSDFKSNEYRKLIGGSRYEPRKKTHAGLPWCGALRERGSARPLPWSARPHRVRNDMGLTNVQVMVPFVRTLGQAERVTQLLAQHGLQRGENELKLIMMCEIPSNAILAEQFLRSSTASPSAPNDLTQLTLGLDRDFGPGAAGA